MTTEIKIYWIVGICSLLLLVGSIFIPAERPDLTELPWHIEHPSPETTKVFGLTLGISTPSDAEQRFKEKAEFALFKSTDGKLSGEAFFEQINLAGLRSKVVLTLLISDSELLAMHDRGLRMTSTGGNGKKISLAPTDLMRLSNSPIGSLTLIPGVRVEAALFQKRFGKPTHTVKEANSDVTHSLYSQHALDIITSGIKSEKQVLQYVAPKDFRKLLDPLLTNGGQLHSE